VDGSSSVVSRADDRSGGLVNHQARNAMRREVVTAAGPEGALAAFVSGLRREDLPPAVAERVQDLLLDAIASALAGRQTVELPAMAAAAAALGAGRDATVIGGGRLSLSGATLLNGYQITAATICDVHRPILCHVTPVVVPPALAIAERQACAGADFLAALAAGFETTVRIGLATTYARFRARGWHSPGVIGPFGGAAAAARLLELDSAATRNALGFAGSQAAGTFAGLGTSQVKFHQARGALSGLLAGLVAGEGFDAAPRFLTAPDGGLLSVYSDGGEPDRLTKDLGRTWELMGISLRRWPSASSLQAVVQAALVLLDGSDLGLEAVERVEVDLPEGSYRLNGGREWHDQLGAFQSAAYVAAVVLLDRRCWLEQFAAERIHQPDIARLVRDRIVVRVDPGLPSSGARLTALFAGRAPLSVRVDVPSGDPAAPLSRSDLRAKLDTATAGTGLEGRAGRIEALVHGLASAPSIEPLARALRVEGGPAGARRVRGRGGRRASSDQTR
jgi:2-methylcitrate dehydratase PrpD